MHILNDLPICMGKLIPHYRVRYQLNESLYYPAQRGGDVYYWL